MLEEKFRDIAVSFEGWESIPRWTTYLDGGGCQAAFDLVNTKFRLAIRVVMSVSLHNYEWMTHFETTYLSSSDQVYTSTGELYIPNEDDVLDIQGNIIKQQWRRYNVHDQN